MLESLLEAGLTSAGVGVRLLHTMPTPAVAYMTRTLRADAGIVISAALGGLLGDMMWFGLARWRGQGLGRRLMDALLGHPELADVHHFELYCLEEMAPFYEQWGFQSDLGALRFLRRAGRA